MSPDSPDTARPLGEISQAPGAFEQFLDRNQKGIVVVAILGVLAAAGLVVHRGIERGREHGAGAALNQANDLASLQNVVTKHSGTAAASSAMVLLADEQWTEGQQDAAITTLRDFLSKYPKHPARPSALASLGTKLKSQGKTGDAAEAFNQIVSDPSGRYLAPFALISLGDIAASEGNTDKATSYYEQASNDYPESSFSDTATRRIALLKADAPAEIDPPAAPEASPTGENSGEPASGEPEATPEAEEPATGETPEEAPPAEEETPEATEP